jgi:hypothetical protein
MSNITSRSKAIESLLNCACKARPHSGQHVHPSSSAPHLSSRHRAATNSLFAFKVWSGPVANASPARAGAVSMRRRNRSRIQGGGRGRGMMHHVSLFTTRSHLLRAYTPTGKDARTLSAPADDFPRSRLLVVAGASAHPQAGPDQRYQRANSGPPNKCFNGSEGTPETQH